MLNLVVVLSCVSTNLALRVHSAQKSKGIVGTNLLNYKLDPPQRVRIHLKF